MKKTVRIRFCLEILLVVVILLLLWIFIVEAKNVKQNHNPQPDSYETQQTSKKEIQDGKAEETLSKEVLYVLKLEEDYVVIYQAEEGELYDKTDIRSSVLPENLRRELLEGIPVYSQKELYDFLENYSS